MKFLAGIVVGLLLALVLGSVRSAEAQGTARMYGTLSTGAQKAILTTSDGAVVLRLN